MNKKICLITGGAGFLGRKYCEFFLKENFKVICVDVDKKKLKQLKKIRNKNLILYNCDISNHSKVKKLFNLVNKRFFVDVLINNAAVDAVPYKKKGREQKYPSEAMWNKEFDVSLKGSFFMIKFFGERMIEEKRGSIINIGSDLSVIAPNQKIYKSSYSNYIKPVTYSIIKHGMVGLNKYFSSLYGKYNVRVNMISPGPVRNQQSKQLISRIKNMTPMNRLGSPDDLRGLLIFLASDASQYVTGQNILVDGGKTII